MDTQFLGYPPNASARVGISFLVSYEHMGTARISCAAHCTCQPVEVDGHSGEQQVGDLRPVHCQLIDVDAQDSNKGDY